jgi:hypothetical protein
MKRLSLTLIILVLIQSCSDQGSKLTDESYLISDDFQSYSLSKDLPKVRFSEVIETIELVRLEETSSSLLSYLNAIETSTNHLVFTSGKNLDVYVFNRNGDFEQKINRKGDGPEEYEDITDLWLEGDTIVVYSRKQKKVIRYDFEGNFIRADKLPNLAGHIYGYNKGYAMDMNYYPLNDTSYYRFVVFNDQIEPIQKYLKINSLIPQGLSFSNNSISSYKEGLLFHRMMNDTVYYFRDEKFTPLVHFDFGDEWYWKEIKEINPNFFAEIVASKAIWSTIMLMNERYVWVFPVEGINKKRASFLVGRATGVVRQVNMQKSLEGNYLGSALGWDNGKMVFTAQSVELSDLLSELSEDQIKFRKGTTLEEIESSENPVLMWVKFKEEY